MAMRKHDNFPMFIARVPRMRTMLHLSMHEKASQLAQSWCPSCELVVDSALGTGLATLSRQSRPVTAGFLKRASPYLF
jgi:hypothetical protein